MARAVHMNGRISLKPFSEAAMMVFKKLAGIAVFAAGCALSMGAAAAPFGGAGGYCSSSTDPATGGISTSNMTLNGNNATDCYGLVDIGGDVENEISNINQLGWGTYSSDNSIKDSGSGSATKSFLGLSWTLSADNDSNNSTYTLTVLDLNLGAAPNLPFTVDIIGFLKAGTPGAFYFFDDAVIDTSNSGTFKIVWTVGRNGSNPDLSGLSLFIGEPGQKVPEPSSLALLGIALAGMGFVARRRRV